MERIQLSEVERKFDLEDFYKELTVRDLSGVIYEQLPMTKLLRVSKVALAERQRADERAEAAEYRDTLIRQRDVEIASLRASIIRADGAAAKLRQELAEAQAGGIWRELFEARGELIKSYQQHIGELLLENHRLEEELKELRAKLDDIRGIVDGPGGDEW